MSGLPLLALRDVVKRYGPVAALDGVGLAVAPGEIHALVGENGAGKSTLLKILCGALALDAGTLTLAGREVAFRSPADALAAGVSMIPQDLQLVPAMSVAENIVLGAEPVGRHLPLLDARARDRAAADALALLGTSFDLAVPAGALSLAHRQLVEIARALARRVRILALDEPTASLTPRETAHLFGTLRKLAAEGAGILYVSHRLEEVEEIADRVTVLRDGRVALSAPASALDRASIVRAMVGRELEASARLDAPRGEEILRLEGVAGPEVAGVDLVLHRGEILGLAGLVGAGRTALARLIFGADRRSRGRIVLEGGEVAPRSPREAISLGIGFLTEDRDRLGLVRQMNVRENVTLAGLRRFCLGPFVRRAREGVAVRAQAGRLRLKAPSLEAPVGQLSGGNRQKVVLARWLLMRSRVLLLDEPTLGVDVGARQEIHALARELAGEGCGVLVISSDLDELLSVAHRIVVMSRGRIAGELPAADATRERIMTLATA